MINRLMEKKRQGEEGFTLIEMLIVVIILGILAAVVVFGVSTFRDDSVKSACNTAKKQVETAVSAYVAKHSASPDNQEPGVAPDSPQSLVPEFLRSYPTSADYKIDYDKTGTSGFTVSAEAPTSTDATPVVFANC